MQKRSLWPRKSQRCDHSPRAEHPGIQSQVGLRTSLWTKLVEVKEFQLSYFKSWKTMVWKYCTQYASKFGKLSSGHRTGKGQFSFQSQKGNAKECSTATAAKSLQSCPTLCDPRDGSPSGSPIPGILQARKLGWVSISFSSAWKWKVKVELLSHVQLLATPWTATH